MQKIVKYITIIWLISINVVYLRCKNETDNSLCVAKRAIYVFHDCKVVNKVVNDVID